MANHFGYNQQFTDLPGMWQVDGYAVIVDGSGTAKVVTNSISTQGSLVSNQSTAPSSVIKSIVRNSAGNYNLNLVSTWVQLESVQITSCIPSGSPALLLAQVLSDTVGNTAFGPAQASPQSVHFVFVVPSTGTATDLAAGDGFYFSLRLKNSSA